MFVVIVEFTIKPGFIDELRERVKRQAEDSLRLEADCHRFDACIDFERADFLLLYELYSDRAAFDTHLVSSHFIDFDATVRDWISDKRVASYSLI
jgi:autoinducer 2-degrading protein